jgi:hypothetical protein
MQTPQVTDVQDTRSAPRSQRGRAPRPCSLVAKAMMSGVFAVMGYLLC